MNSQSLSDVKVLEIGEFIAAPYCGKLLADLGANVVKVEVEVISLMTTSISRLFLLSPWVMITLLADNTNSPWPK